MTLSRSRQFLLAERGAIQQVEIYISFDEEFANDLMAERPLDDGKSSRHRKSTGTRRAANQVRCESPPAIGPWLSQT
jgi:hypothetical protein